MDALEELVARSKIQQLAVRYAFAVDGKDIDTLATLYVDDIDYGVHGIGPEGVKRFFDAVLRGSLCSMHLIGNHLVEFDDDTHAHGVLYCQVHLHVREPDHWSETALAYFDRYERRGDEWLFADRRLARWYRQDFGHPDHGVEPQVPGPEWAAYRLPDVLGTVEPFLASAPLS